MPSRLTSGYTIARLFDAGEWEVRRIAVWQRYR